MLQVATWVSRPRSCLPLLRQLGCRWLAFSICWRDTFALHIRACSTSWELLELSFHCNPAIGSGSQDLLTIACHASNPSCHFMWCTLSQRFACCRSVQHLVERSIDRSEPLHLNNQRLAMCRCDGGECSLNDGHETVSAHGAQRSSHQKQRKETAQTIASRVLRETTTDRWENTKNVTAFEKPQQEKQTHDRCRRHTKPTLPTSADSC